MMPPLLFLDTETTGFKAPHAIQIAYAKMEYGKEEVETRNAYYRPPIAIEPGASAVHGIADDDLCDLASLPETTDHDALQELMLRSIIVCHNTEYDLAVLGNDGLTPVQWICTLRVARKLFPGLQSYKLQVLRQYLRLDPLRTSSAHDALGDVTIMILLFKELWRKGMTAMAGTDGEKERAKKVLHWFISLSR